MPMVIFQARNITWTNTRRISITIHRHWYRFNKGLTQNLNLRTNLEREYNIKSLNYIQRTKDFKPGSYFIELWLLRVWHAQWFKSY